MDEVIPTWNGILSVIGQITIHKFNDPILNFAMHALLQLLIIPYVINY